MLKALAVSATFAVITAQSVPAQAADALKIGVLLPMSGVLAALGREQLNGINIGVEQSGGTVAGRKIELIIEDTEAKAQVGLTKARKLVLSDKVDVVAGVISSAVALSAGPYLSRAKVPLVITNAGTDLLSGAKCDRYILRASYSMSQSTAPIADWMAKNGVKNVFIMGSDYVAPHESVAAFKKVFTAGGGKIAGEIWTPFGRTQDFGPYLAQARAAKPDAIFAVYYGGEAILFTKQYDAFGLNKTIPLYSAFGLTPRILHRAQKQTAVGVIQSTNYVAELPHSENKKFVAAYQKKFNQLPGEFAVYANDAIQIVLAAVKARKGDTKDNLALVSAMEKVSFTGPRGPIKLNSTNRSVTQNFYIAKTVKTANGVGFELIDTLPNYEDPVTGCKLK